MRIFIFLCLLLSATFSSAQAQVYNFGCSTLTHATDTVSNSTASTPADDQPEDCGQTSGNSAAGAPGSTADEDTHYDDLCLRKNEVQGAKPQGCMVHKRMPAIPDGNARLLRTLSPLNLNPWYMISLQDPANEYHPYMGPLYRGESNYAHQYTRLSQVDPLDTTNGCIPQIKPDTGGIDPYDPFWMRAERDNCANQYILTRARYARFAVETAGARPMPLPSNRASELCQPLRLIPMNPGDQEFVPSDYIYNAWKKLLAKPSHLYRGGKASSEPLYSRIGVTIPSSPDNRIWPPTKDATPFRCSNNSQKSFGKACINSITDAQVERILDPSHPFSPRWDFRGNDRDTYAPWTVIYTQDPLTILYGVRCAGDNAARYYKVDIMPWRAKAFQRGIMRRLLWNIVCRYAFATFYGIITWECWDGSISFLGSKVLTGIPWNCKENKKGGESGDNDYGQCCATNWGGEDAKTILDLGVMEFFCGRGDKSILKLCKKLASSIPIINPLKIRKTDLYNFPLGVPEGYKFTDYFGFHRPYLRCWDTGKECGTGDPVNDPKLLEAQGARVAIIGAGREKESCTLGGGQGESSTRTSVKFPGLYDSNWLNQIESLLATYGNISSSVGAMTNGGGGVSQNSLKSTLSGMSNAIGSGIEILEMADRQDMAEPITSWSELKQYQMRATRDFGLNCLAKNEQVFKQGTGEDMILGRAGAHYQRLIMDDAGNGVLSYTRYITNPWPKGWRGYITDRGISRRFPNFGSEPGGFDFSGQLTNLAEYIGLEAVGELDTGHKADGQNIGGVGLNNAKVGDILLFDQDVVLQGDRHISHDANWRLPYIAYVTEANLNAADKGGLDPTSQLAGVIAPGIKKQWVSVLAFNHGKFPDACGNTDAWGDGQEYKIFAPATAGTARLTDLPKDRQEELAAFQGKFSGTGTVRPYYTVSCQDPRNSQCVEERWNDVKRYSIREDQRALGWEGAYRVLQDFCASNDCTTGTSSNPNQAATAAGD